MTRQPHERHTSASTHSGYLTPSDFATDTTEIRYVDGSRAPFLINATTTDKGTWPVGSQWRKNPIPMCGCDIGTGCGSKAAAVEKAEEEGERSRRQRSVIGREEIEQECAEVRFAGEGERVVAGCAVGARGGERRRRRRVEQFAAARRLDGAFPRGEQFTQLLVAMLFD